jgi:hypothetical protein
VRLKAGWDGFSASSIREQKCPTFFAFLGLIAFPIGTIINAYILYLLLSAKGKYVFSADYRAVITATPHIRYKMSFIVWGFIWLVIALLLLAFGISLYTKH